MQYNIILLLLFLAIPNLNASKTSVKRALQKSHEKPQEDKWMEAFFGKNTVFDQVPSLVQLVNTVAQRYLYGCTTIFLYDSEVEQSDGLLLQQLFKVFENPYIHGQISSSYRVKQERLLNSLDNKCINYVLFVKDVMKCDFVIGEQNMNKVVVVARSSQWRVYEFLATEAAQSFINLLVIAQSEKTSLTGDEMPYILYTHDLFIDALGSSSPKVLTSWIKGSLTRPKTNLFPKKITNGFEGHRFIISLGHQPPFVIKKGVDEFDSIVWDGSEVRLLRLLSGLYNFTTDFKEAKELGTLGAGDAISKEIKNKKANIGIGGLYVTEERIGKIDVSHPHSQDCAAFISLTSTALPKYRAIMGPFHWTVWLALTLTYLFAIFPIAFSDKHTLKPLLKNPEEIENMFWYVFGTFTNCFSFTGKKSWNKSSKVTTRILVGFYWLFTIITTACYTGSIIAFVTLPIYPQTIDTVKQLLNGRYQVGTLDKGGWQYWFENSTDPTTTKLFKNIEYIPDVESGIRNTTKAFFWPYAFLGSRAQLDYIVRTNFTTTSKRSLLHISKECFVPYGVSLMFTVNSVYKTIVNEGILRAYQSGFMIKFKHDVEWDMMRSSTGKLLQASSGITLRSLSVEDRALTLDDTQGMFLLLGAGFLIGGGCLLSEWFGGCLNLCKGRRAQSAKSIDSNPRSYDTLTPREKINSVQYNNIRLGSIIDIESDFFGDGGKITDRSEDEDDGSDKNNGNNENKEKDTKKKHRSFEDANENSKNTFKKHGSLDEMKMESDGTKDGIRLRNKGIKNVSVEKALVHDDGKKQGSFDDSHQKSFDGAGLDGKMFVKRADLDKIKSFDGSNMTQGVSFDSTKMDNKKSFDSTDLDGAIDKLFNLDELYGEEVEELETVKEEIKDVDDQELNHNKI